MQDHQPSRRIFIKVGCSTVAALLALSAGLGAEAAAIEQLRILCTGPAGSIPDIMARRVADALTGQYCQRALVENRPGAAGQIAVNALKVAPNDGSTVLLAQGAIAVPEKVMNVRDFVDWMRLNPKLANVASPGTGTLPHLLAAMLFRAAQVEWQHVVYTGGPSALVDLMGGQIAALVLPEGLLRQHKEAGKLRVLGTSGATRSAYLPDVASFSEQGYSDCVVREWFGFFMQARVPATAIDHASQAIRNALAQPALVKTFSAMAISAMGSSSSAMAARIVNEQRYWGPVIRTIGVRAD